MIDNALVRPVELMALGLLKARVATNGLKLAGGESDILRMPTRTPP